MSADKPKPSPARSKDASEGAHEKGKVRLTGFKPGPPEVSDLGIGEIHTFVWEGNEIEAVGDVLRRSTGLVISRLEVRVSETAPAGLTHQMLRTVPLGEILAAARAWRPELNHPRLHMRGGPSATTLPPGRVEVTDDLLRQVALAYLEESAPGKDRAILQRLADRFSRPKGTVRTWIGRARDEGWLGPAVQGRMGAEAGPRLLDEWARQPMVKEVTADGTVVIQAPPPEGSETPEEARTRVMTWLASQPDQAPE